MNCVPRSDAPADLSDDAFLGGRLRLLQPRRGHRSGHDAMMLAAATAAGSGDALLDLGSGVGAAGLAVAARVGGVDLTFVDVDGSLVTLAVENARRNGFGARGVCLDVGASAAAFAGAGLVPDRFDSILMNPPFNDPRRHRPSPDAQRRRAHEAGAATIETWMGAARRILKPGGALTLIWRPETLGEMLAALRLGFGGVAILPLHPRPGAAASRVIIRATKGARGGLALIEGVVLNTEAGQPTDFIRAVLEGRQALPLAQM